ncbi:MAG: YmdB family metallophosphoesterase [Planctomycetota bacterium]
MAELTLAVFGDVVGRPGREAFTHAAAVARRDLGADLIIVNGENARHGRGLHPDGYRDLRDAGADAVTLGDHYLDDPRVVPLLLDAAEPVARPVNGRGASGAETAVRLEAGQTSLWIITVLGRLFMREEVDDPIAAIDARVETIVEREPDSLVLVEVHAEATSEKIAAAWHCLERWPRRVVGVVGSHTHVPTADARILDGLLAAQTDLGMCGALRGVIGFAVDASLRRLRDQGPSGLKLASEDPCAQGCLLRIDTDARAATAIQTLSIHPDGLETAFAPSS